MDNEELTSTPEPAEEQQESPAEVPAGRWQRWKARIGAKYARTKQKLSATFEHVFRPFMDSFLPQPHYLKDEEVELEIRMAYYRKRVPQMLAWLSALLFLVAILGLAITVVTHSDSLQMMSAALLLLGLLILFESVRGMLFYEQWRFILTNKRLILVTPDPDREGFADAIYLGRKSIKVLDTNFTTNPMWGFFQITRGSRDVMLSPSGYEFREKGAKVKGGLRFPDVMPEDIEKLKELIFGG